MTTTIDPERVRRLFLLGLVVIISSIFLFMIRGMLMALFLAAIGTGLIKPMYRRIETALGNRPSAAAVLTILIVLVGIIGPLTVFAGVVASQAVQITELVGPFLQDELDNPDLLDGLVERFPRFQAVLPFKGLLLSRVGDLASSTGGFLLASLAAATRGTVHFIFLLFVMLYSMFFFLRDGPKILDRILYLLPLSSSSEERMVARFVSVTRATIKGTLIIGVVQGALAGLALGLAGIHGVAFWSTVMVVLSIIPGIGTALVWFPAVIYLAAVGKGATAVAVFLWCAIVVGTADNFLRPMLVGRDTEMSDLLILLSTLGGLVMFGAAGIVVGPIIAALFVTVWDLYAAAFREYLPSTTPQPESG